VAGAADALQDRRASRRCLLRPPLEHSLHAPLLRAPDRANLAGRAIDF
jgi:hypothetical protein